MKTLSHWARLSVAAAVLVLLQSRITQAAAPATGAATEPQTIKVNFPTLLRTYGEKYSLYFTVERDEVDSYANVKDASGDPKPSPLRDRDIQLPAALKDGDAFLEALGQSLPEAEIMKDEAMPAVVHIREKSLAKRTGYLLDKKADFLFRGTSREFLAEIARQSDWSFEKDNNATPNSRGFSDTIATVVFLKGGTYRTILSMGVPRWNNHLLWSSYAIKKEGRLVTVFKASPSSPPPATATATATTPTLPPGAAAEIDAAMQRRHQAQQALDQAAATIVSRPENPVTEVDPDRIGLMDKMITVIVPLRNIPARRLLNDLQPMLAPQAVAGLLNDPNSLVISDSSAHLHQLLQIIKSLEDAAGLRRDATVARGADPRGLAWVQSIDTPPSSAVTTPAAGKATDRFLSPVYNSADPAGVRPADTVRTQIISLQYASAATAASDLKSLLGPDAVLAVSPTANCLILTDKSQHVRQLMETIAKLDHPASSTVPATKATAPPRP